MRAALRVVPAAGRNATCTSSLIHRSYVAASGRGGAASTSDDEQRQIRVARNQLATFQVCPTALPRTACKQRRRLAAARPNFPAAPFALPRGSR